MKITIAGCGKVGTVIAEQLIKEDHDIIIIDKDGSRLAYVSNSLDLLPVQGDAASVSTLKEAGADRSDLMIAVTDSDESNILICVLAKKLGIKNTIARIRNPEFSDTVQVIKEEMGLSFVVNPEKAAADEIFRSLLFKGAGQVETFAQGQHEILTCAVKDNKYLCGLQLKNLSSFINRRILICAIKRGDSVFIPNGSTVIEKGDILSIVASRSDAVYFFRKLGYETGKIRDLTVIGGGRLGFYLSMKAVEHGIPVMLIEKDPERCRKLDYDLPPAEIFCGDGTDISMLEEEGVFRSSAVATVTGSDEANVLISMYISKKSKDTKLITVVKKSDFEDMLYGLELGNVFNPKYIAADKIITYVRAMEETEGNEVQSLCHVIDNKVEVLEFFIDSNTSVTGIPLNELKFKPGVLLAGITRKGRSFIPGGNDTIEAADTILLVTTTRGIGRLDDLISS